MTRFIALILLLVLFSSQANSLEQAEGDVKGFYIAENEQALLKLTNETAGCGTVGSGGWDFSFSSSSVVGKQWASMILAARMAKTGIRVGYLPAATSGGDCELGYVYFYDF